METKVLLMYVGSAISNNIPCRSDLDVSIKVAHTAYEMLSRQVVRNHGLTVKAQLMIFLAVVFSTLLYACVNWTLLRLERFQQRKTPKNPPDQQQ